MRLYLDICVYNRPFDDQRQTRIVIETLEFLYLLSMAEKGEITLVNSFAIEDENSKNPYANRKDIINDILATTTENIDYDEDLGDRARELEKLGIMSMDALHIACAEKAKADFFVTCDDILVRKYEGNKKRIKVKIAPLMEFINREVFKI
ncbi:MAG: PIN domain-containing protein [Nitrospirota bacterium]